MRISDVSSDVCSSFLLSCVCPLCSRACVLGMSSTGQRLGRILLRPKLSRRLFRSTGEDIGAESTSKQNVNNFGQSAETLKTLARLLMERLAHYGVQILTNERDRKSTRLNSSH